MINLEKFVAVSGQGSLFKMVASRPNGLILEDMSNGKQNFYSARIYQFSPLESIGIYTLEDTKPLKEVYETFYSQSEVTPIPEVNAEDTVIKEYFAKVLPDYDRYKVHLKDMKKCLKWFHQLSDLKLIDGTTELGLNVSE